VGNPGVAAIDVVFYQDQAAAGEEVTPNQSKKVLILSGSGLKRRRTWGEHVRLSKEGHRQVVNARAALYALDPATGHLNTNKRGGQMSEIKYTPIWSILH